MLPYLISMCILQLYKREASATVHFKAELQSSRQRLQQLQQSYDNMVSIADGHSSIAARLEPTASQGRMMAALLEMLLNRSPGSEEHGATPVEQLQNMIKELESLRYIAAYPVPV